MTTTTTSRRRTRRDNPSNASQPLTTRFAHKFLKTLLKIKKSSKPPSPSSRLSSSSAEMEIRRRTQRIKLASYSSMARVVGSRRAWSRALILKLSVRRKSQYRSLSAARSTNPLPRCFRVMRTRSKTVTKRFIAKKRLLGKGSDCGVNELRRLVPGGDLMDVCCLLEETAHFVRCLETQVGVMRSITDHLPC